MRKIIWILCVVLFLSACTGNGNVFDPPDITNTTDGSDLADLSVVMKSAIFYDTPYVGDLRYREFWRVSEEDRMDHPVLQSEVGKIPISYPITTLGQVEQYTNELYKISVSLELLDSDLISGTAFIYSDGVIVIGFRPAGMHDTLAYDGVSAHVLVSAEDGHVIHFDVSEGWE